MPESKEYGQHLTMDQVTKLMAVPLQNTQGNTDSTHSSPLFTTFLTI
jgi:hypothetical protein